MKLFELLLESRVDFLRDKYIPLIADKYKISRVEGSDFFDKFKDNDPTNNKIYLQWFLNRALLEFGDYHYIIFFIDEDLYKWKEYLSIYDKVKSKLPLEQRDINKLSLEDLKNIALQYKQKEEEILTKNDYLDKKYKINETNQYLVYMFKTATQQDFKMYQLVSTNTEWCTRPDYDTFKEYINKSPLFVFINKSNRLEKYQYHEFSGQFMNAKDWVINSEFKIKLIPLMSKYLLNNTLFKVFISETLGLSGHVGFINKRCELVVEGFKNADAFNNNKGYTWVDIPGSSIRNCYMTKDLRFFGGGEGEIPQNDPRLKVIKIYPENLIK